MTMQRFALNSFANLRRRSVAALEDAASLPQADAGAEIRPDHAGRAPWSGGFDVSGGKAYVLC
jgi:hypothetical protein